MIGTEQKTEVAMVFPKNIVADRGVASLQLNIFGQTDEATGKDALTHVVFISEIQAKELAARLDELVSEE